jgi:hypothetical protein
MQTRDSYSEGRNRRDQLGALDDHIRTSHEPDVGFEMSIIRKAGGHLAGQETYASCTAANDE